MGQVDTEYQSNFLHIPSNSLTDSNSNIVDKAKELSLCTLRPPMVNTPEDSSKASGKLSHRAAKAFSINSDSTDKRGFKTGGGKKTDIVRDCVEVLLREGYDIDESLAQLAIEIYTR